MGILYEHNSDNIDFQEYSFNQLGSKEIGLNYIMLGGYPEYSRDKNSIVYSGTYTSNSVEHTALIGYIKCDNFAVEIICDASSSIFPELEGEMRSFIKEFRIINWNWE